MESIEFSLDLNKIKTLPFNKYDYNFTFIVNGKIYRTNRIVADLLSPIIRNYHYGDATINEFTIHTKEQNDFQGSEDNDYFQDFLSLCNLNHVKIDKTRQNYFSQYFLQLGNISEYFNLQLEMADQLSSENIIDRLSNLADYMKIQQKESEISFSDNIFEKFIEFASTHFHSIDKEKMKNLDKSIIEEIISNESLQLEEEDELLRFILELYENDHNFYDFFEYVEFKNVKEKTLEEFIEKFSINDLSLGTWKSICRRLLPSKVSENDKRRFNGKVIEFIHVENQEFKGILKHLCDESGGNAHDKGVIEITSNSIYGKEGQPKNVIDYQNNNNFYESSANIENATLCFDFKKNGIKVSSYSIKTSGCGYHLKNWVIEVSNDGKNWEKIDEHINDSALNKNNAIATFDVKETNSFYRFIRLRQTGKSWSNDYNAVIYSFEFYGKLMMHSI